MRSYAIVGLLIFSLLAVPAAAGSEPATPKPAFHEEGSRFWDDLTRQLLELGSRWREHFGPRESTAERPLITFMLSHRDDLALSSDQVRNLERLRNDFEREGVRHEADIRVAEMDLAELLRADAADLKRAEAKVREIERLRADLRLARIRAIEQGKGSLSQEQREKLRSLLSGTHYSRRPNREPR